VDLSSSASGKRANLAGAHLEGADFSSANLHGANLANASVVLAPGTLKVQRMDSSGALSPAAVAYDVTRIAREVADEDTVWPNRSTGSLTNPAEQLKAPDPPRPPSCVPSLTDWRPKPKRQTVTAG